MSIFLFVFVLTCSTIPVASPTQGEITNSSLPTEQERTACKQQMNVHEVSTNCKCNNTPTECVIAGNTQRQYACVPGSTEPQVVFGMGMMGKISKIN